MNLRLALPRARKSLESLPNSSEVPSNLAHKHSDLSFFWDEDLAYLYKYNIKYKFRLLVLLVHCGESDC